MCSNLSKMSINQNKCAPRVHVSTLSSVIFLLGASLCWLASLLRLQCSAVYCTRVSPHLESRDTRDTWEPPPEDRREEAGEGASSERLVGVAARETVMASSRPCSLPSPHTGDKCNDMTIRMVIKIFRSPCGECPPLARDSQLAHGLCPLTSLEAGLVASALTRLLAEL